MKDISNIDYVPDIRFSIVLMWQPYVVHYEVLYVEQNKEYAKEKLKISILTIGGEAAIGNFTTASFQMVANNVTGITLPNTGHFIPEERPNFLIKQITLVITGIVH